MSKNKLRLEALITQAKSLSLLTYGNDEAGFDALHNADKDVVLWLLSDLLHEAHLIVTGGRAND